jgi:hypothetical protein
MLVPSTAVATEFTPEQIAATQWIRAVADQVDFTINAQVVQQQLAALEYGVRIMDQEIELERSLAEDVEATIETDRSEREGELATADELDRASIVTAAAEGIGTTADYAQQLQDMLSGGELDEAEPAELVQLAEDIVRRMEQLEAEMERLESAVELAEDELSAASEEDYEALAAELDALIDAADPWFEEAVDTAENLEGILTAVMEMGEEMVAAP